MLGRAVLIIGPALLAGGLSLATGGSPDPAPTAEDRLDLARRAYSTAYEDTLKALATPPTGGTRPVEGVRQVLSETTAERLGSRSRRWMEVERDLGGTKAERLSALRGHLDRMMDLEAGGLLRDWMKQSGIVARDEALARAMRRMGEFRAVVESFRREAESRLVGEDSK
jgi:hypothetical protein